MLVEESSEVVLINGEDDVVSDISKRLGELRVELNCWWMDILRQRQYIDDVRNILTRQLLIREQSGKEREVQRPSLT